MNEENIKDEEEFKKELLRCAKFVAANDSESVEMDVVTDTATIRMKLIIEML